MTAEKQGQNGKINPQTGLATIQVMAEVLGNPQEQLSIVHIAGTNGKGSCTAMLSHILQQAGYRVGIFTSPHLHSYTERIRINKDMISETRFMALRKMVLDKVVPPLREKGMDGPKEFELLTMMALYYYAQEKVDIVLLEVGLGGRLDSTNIVSSKLAIIMSIGLDHCAVLGNTVEAIAWEKAGIIKPQVPVVTAIQHEEGVMAVLEEAAAAQKSPLIRADQVHYHITDFHETGQTFDLTTPARQYRDLHITLIGQHQVENAAAVVLAAEALQQMGWAIRPEDIKMGLAATTWPGRMEYWPLDEGNKGILMDGAHNLAGVQVLTQGLETYFADRPLVLLLGILDDKDQRDMLEVLLPYGEQAIITRPADSRAEHWRQLADIVGEIAPQLPLLVIDEVTEAVEKGLAVLPDNGILCITGSLYLLGTCRGYLQSVHKNEISGKEAKEHDHISG